MDKTKISFEELRKKNTNEWNRAVIVFSQESFTQPYSEIQRSYEISSSSNYFHSDKISKSLFSHCLDGTDDGVRLDLYIHSLPKDNLGKRWIVEYCYIVD